MTVLLDGDIPVHYGFLFLQPPDESPDLLAARGGQANGSCGAALPGVLSLITGLHTGLVPLLVEYRRREGGALPGHRRGRGLRLRAGGAAAALRRRRAGSGFSGVQGIEQFSDRVQPQSPGLRGRLWYGGASTRSAVWAGEHRMNFLTSSVIRAEESEDFGTVQQSQVRAFRAAHPDGAAARVSQGLVVIPTDSASAAQKAKYAAYVESRMPRTTSPQGPARMMFAPDLLGDSGRIAEALYGHAGFREVTEVAFALPFSFEEEDYVQILTDIAGRLGPALGWAPRG